MAAAPLARRRHLLAPLLMVVALWSPGAGARVDTALGYTKTQTYSAALRYLRVDLGYEVTERDADAAYLLFRYAPTGGKSEANGSIEIIEAGSVVRIFVRLPSRPRYHEQMLTDGFLAKLRDEYGDAPQAAKKARKPASKGDPGGAGEDSAKDASKPAPGAPAQQPSPPPPAD